MSELNNRIKVHEVTDMRRLPEGLARNHQGEKTRKGKG